MNGLLLALSKLPATLLFIIGAGTIILGDFYAKLWSSSTTITHASLSMLFYILGGLIFISIVRHTHSVGVSNVLWNIIGIIGTLLISYFFFSETITAKQFTGIMLGIISIILIT